MSIYQIDKLMAEARRLAAEYRRQTGKALAISGEIAVADAIRLLDLRPAPGDAQGYDATRPREAGDDLRLQIKARVVFDDARRPHRLGQLKLEQGWDAVLLVLMDENYEPVEIYEASREAVEAALAEAKPNRRGTMSVARFRHIGHCAWQRDAGAEARA